MLPRSTAAVIEGTWIEGKARLLAAGLVALTAVSVVVLVAFAGPARADTTFTVNSTVDPGTGGCDATECTLREAMSAANNSAGHDTIDFNIADDPIVASDEVKSIILLSGLPFLTDPVTIDGYTQTGAKPNELARGTDAALKIELRPHRSAPQKMAGLFVNTSNSVIRGLVVNRFDVNGILIGGTANRIEGNFLGTDPSGTHDLGNRHSGVGTISGAASGNFIGGSTPAARNLISGNDESGVFLNSPGNTVEGNLIGTQKNGKSALGNYEQGIRIIGAADNTVGGTAAGAANTIAFNGLDGVEVGGTNIASVNRILGNSIFSNGELGIDLLGPGENLPTSEPTPNDPGDTDEGPNGLQNTPVITSAATTSGATTIKGRLDSTASTTFTIQFFSNPSGDEGKKFIGEQSVTTGSDGIARLNFRPGRAVKAGQSITATATGPEGTSEFSAPREVITR